MAFIPFKTLQYGDFFELDGVMYAFQGSIGQESQYCVLETGEQRFGFLAKPDTLVCRRPYPSRILSGWLDPLNGRVCSVQRKHEAHPNSDVGKHFTIPLYT